MYIKNRLFLTRRVKMSFFPFLHGIENVHNEELFYIEKKSISDNWTERGVETENFENHQFVPCTCTLSNYQQGSKIETAMCIREQNAIILSHRDKSISECVQLW